MKTLYLDQAATTKVKPEVLESMLPYLKENFYNPSSLYSNGVKVKNAIEEARKTVADFINADDDEIYFTSCGSESNCWAIKGFVDEANMRHQMPFVITTTIEHHSIMECTKAIEKLTCMVEYVGVTELGLVNLDELRESLETAIENTRPENILVSVQFANNEIGSIQDIKFISSIVHEYGAKLHVDAVQAFGHITIDVKDMGIDMLSASGHKIGAPKGSGILYKDYNVDIQPLIYGSQMNGKRGGTENVAGIVGFAKAVELAKEDMRNNQRLCLIRDYFIDKLQAIGCTLNGSFDYRLPSNINVMLPRKVGSEETMLMLDLSGIQCSVGSACNSRSKEPSHVLRAIGMTDEEAARSIRFTISQDITKEDIDYVIDEIERCIKLIKGDTITWNGWNY